MLFFFSEDGKFQFNQLGHSSQFEKRDRLNLINKINKDDFLNLDKLKTLSKYWLILQKKENIKLMMDLDLLNLILAMCQFLITGLLI